MYIGGKPMKWPGVDGDGALGGQQRVERDRERARVEVARVAGVLERRVAPRAGGDLLLEPGRGAEARGRRRRRRAAPRRSRRRRRPPRRATGRCAPSDSSSRSTCTTFAPRAISAPSRVVQRVRPAPKASTRSASAISRAAIGEAKPPEMPTAHGEPSNRPWPIAEVASTAPIASPRRSSGSRAPASTAPRPATITGRRAAAISSATSATASGAGAGRSGSRSRPGGGAAGRRLAPGRRAAC